MQQWKARVSFFLLWLRRPTDWGSDIKDLSIYSFLLILIHPLSIYIPKLYTSRVLPRYHRYYHGFIYFFCDLIGYRYFEPLEPRMSDKR